jgi:hypothetical protein
MVSEISKIMFFKFWFYAIICGEDRGGVFEVSVWNLE